MKVRGGFLAIAALLVTTHLSFAETDEHGFIVMQPDKMEWKQFSGVGSTSVTTLHGDASKDGTYVMRIKFPPNLFSRPHVHAEDRHFVVLKGTWYVGTGPDFDPSKAIGVPQGSYVKHPAGQVHWDGAKDEEVILQVIGVGPSATNWESKDTPHFGPAE